MPETAAVAAPNPHASPPAANAAARRNPDAVDLRCSGAGFEAVWPMARARVWPGLRALRAPREPVYDLNGGPHVVSGEPGDALDALLSRLSADRDHPQVIVARAVVAEGPVWDALLRAAAAGRIGLTVTARWERAVLERSAAADADGYLRAFMSPGRRKHLRRKRRALEEAAGALMLDAALDGESAAAALAEFCVIEAGGWKGRAGTALAQRSADRIYVADVLAGMAATGDAFALTLRAGGKPIAAGLFLRADGEAVFWKTAYDESLSRYSPGVVFDVMVTEWLYAQPWFARLDTGIDDSVDPATLIWKQRRRMADVVVDLAPGSWRGRAIAAGQSFRRELRRLKRSIRPGQPPK